MIQGLNEHFNHEYSPLMNVLRGSPNVPNSRGLTVETLSHFSTVCPRKLDIPMKRCRVVLDSSVDLCDLGDLGAIDETGVTCVQANQHDAILMDDTFEAARTTLMVEYETSAIFDIHCSMKQPHDTLVGWHVLVGNLDVLGTVAPDKYYDWEDL